jgi:acyl-CoA synthetase (NDP forming)
MNDSQSAPPFVHRLDPIFRARSVAVVGASADPRKLNAIPLQILRMTGFAGSIYPVNPKYDEIDGTRCYPDVASLPEPASVALILVPAADVPGVLDQCGSKGTRAAVVCSSGFEEVTNSERLVDAVKATCMRHRIALVGPNCEGVWSVRSNVLLTFGSAARRETLVHAPIAMLKPERIDGRRGRTPAAGQRLRLRVHRECGNETVTTLLDHLDYVIAQDDVRVVLLFLEGLNDGERLVRVAARARARGIVIVALKAGSSKAGRAAVASHTGKLTTSHAIYRDVFRQAGIIQVESLVELIEAAEAFSSVSLPRANLGSDAGAAVFSIPGGTRALTADLCEARNVPLARFGTATTAALQDALPAFGVPGNPT